MKKIMFNDKYGLTDAVLSGRKTMTRRIVSDSTLRMARLEDRVCSSPFEECIKYHSYFLCDEEVAIAQSYQELSKIDEFYNCDQAKHSPGWKNKMFVKAHLMPHRIRIKSIKVERLQDISDVDCMREGVFKYEKEPLHHERDPFAPWPPYVKPYKHDIDNLKYYCNPQAAFAHLIDRVSGGGTWHRNPWVFAFEFELIKK